MNPIAGMTGGARRAGCSPGSNIEIQSLGADTVSAATTVGTEWLETHARTVDGKTVLDVGGEQRTLPRADLQQLVRGAAAS